MSQSAVTSATSSSPRRSRERFIGLEWLRFLLGLYIVLFHTLHNYPSIRSWSHYLTDVGFFATSAFFVLSGFLLTHVYLDVEHRMREPARHFWIKRFANLYPIHIGSFLLAIAVSTLVGYLAITADDAGTSFRFVMFDVNNDMGQLNPGSLKHLMDNGEVALNVVLNVLMLHAWNPYYLTFNPPSWSISALFFFYLLFPILAPRLMRLKHTRLALTVTNLIYLVPPLVVIATTQYGMPETGILHRNPIIRLPEFVAGILLCAFYIKRRAAGHRPTGLTCLLLLVFVLGAMAGATLLLRQGHAWYYLLHNGLLLPAQLALIYAALFIPTPRRAWVERLAGRLGGASLPMFALHVPLFVIFSRAERILSGEPGLCPSNFRLCIAAAGDLSLALYPVFLLLTVVFCVVFQEQFVVRIRKKIVGWLLSPKAEAKPAREAPDSGSS
ncbi:acyltransferase family protein [Kushneria phosphatilytica]|uniref:Acyltransferase n=1 Tax=Kushneria phosphatilytica TaxID=657387 RepID=A0A1S1NYP8_9GAMM|nr:acyltransferase [Kushneria phosphatilytica]OHV12872.1 acyltransferase [Kushneria phosphatilytica]QEL10732.1 acyltransferase [Kushneria phosphatilytica]